MAGFGLIVAGAMGGWSEARLDEIKAEREARMKELDDQRAAARAALSEDRADARSDKALAARKAEFDAEQATAGTYSTTDTGETVRVHGDTATPVKGADGKTIKLATKSADKPADQQMVEYLMSLGKTQDWALDWVKKSSTKSEGESKLSLYKAILTANGGDSEAAQAETEKVWEKYGNPSPDDSGAKADGSKAKVRTQDTEDVVTPANIIPADPALRVVGKKYMNSKGQMAIWTGEGWEAVQ